MRRILFESLLKRPLTEAVARAGRRCAGRARRERRARGAAPARPQPVDPPGRCRLLQRLRAGNSRAQQCVLRSGALRPALRRLAAPCRRADGDRAGDQEHARGAAAHLRRDAGSQMGGGGRRLARPTAASSRAAMRWWAACTRWCRSTCTSAAARPTRPSCSRACWLCSSRARRTRSFAIFDALTESFLRKQGPSPCLIERTRRRGARRFGRDDQRVGERLRGQVP